MLGELLPPACQAVLVTSYIIGRDEKATGFIRIGTVLLRESLDSIFLSPFNIHVQDQRPCLALIVIAAIAVNLQ